MNLLLHFHSRTQMVTMNSGRRIFFMKKCWIVLGMILVLLFATTGAQAKESRAISNKPNLSFDGTTACCSVVCTGASSSDTVAATLILYQGSTYVDSWSDSGKGSVVLYGETEVESGKNYNLTLIFSVNGIKKPSTSVTKSCP